MSNTALDTAPGLDTAPALEETLEPLAVAPPAGATAGVGVAVDDETHLRARPVPRISIQVFCEDRGTADVAQAAGGDRRLSKAHYSVHMGGINAAIAHYQGAPTPNLIIVESMLNRDGMLADIDRMAEVCDAGTRVVMIGHINDVVLYRELVSRGVSEYLIAPLSPIQIMESISNLYNDPESDPVGHVVSYLGAKGGVGSSTICHNVAWTVSELVKSNVVVTDMDLPFGTAGLDFNQDPVQGIADALSSPDRLDEVLVDRLLSKCTNHLSLFAAPALLDREYDLDAASCDSIIDLLRQNVPHIALDVPHLWTTWARQMILGSDDVVITATPDLANLRNAKNIVDLLKEHRSNDRPPILVLNQVNTPKRPEIPVKDFAQALEIEPTAVINFDAETFGSAANSGQMIEEFDNRSSAVEHFRHLAHVLANKPEDKMVEQKSILSPILGRFTRKK